jgi:thymidylate synthase (FAD)
VKILDRPRVALKWITPNAEKEIEDAGRVCWESWGKSDGSIDATRAFIGRLKKVGHIDVFEEAELSVWIECSRVSSHQIVRHRTQHHLQASQRYIKASEMQIIVPPSLQHNGERNLFINTCAGAYDQYHKMTEAGIRKEDARYVLPNATLTKMKAKANLSNWRKFFELRSHSTAQWEVRMISNSILKIAYENAPSVFDDIWWKYMSDYHEHDMYADIVPKEYFSNYIQLETLEEDE